MGGYEEEMKLIVRLPTKQFEELTLKVRCPLYHDQARRLICNGFSCLEEERFIFIYAEEPKPWSRDFEHWCEAFAGQIVVDGAIHKRKNKQFLWVELRGLSGED